MKLIKLAAAVLNQTPLDWRGNQSNILAAISEARAQRASVLCLPELCITGYGCEDAFQAPGVQRMALRILQDCLPATQGMIVSFGLPLLHQNGLFNTACLAVDGRVAGFVGKRFLAGDGIHYEPRWFKPWPMGVRSRTSIDDQSYPLGDLHFDVGGVKLGFEICEDAWVANRPGTQLALRGVDVVLNPSASHFAFGKIEVRKRFVLEGSRAFNASYVYANLLGNEAGRAIYDGEAMIASRGQLIATGPRFSYADFLVTSGVVDIEATRMNQSRTASYEPRLEGDLHDVVVAPFQYPSLSPELLPSRSDDWESSSQIKEEEFARAVPLGLFDYLRKSRSLGFVVSLSGGADSSAVACLVSMMVDFGVRELGLEAFIRKLGHIKSLQGCKTAREATRQLLLTVYQATRNSGSVTRAAARSVADAVGAEHHELDVAALHEGYLTMISAALKRELHWDRDDLALQNIQARVRSPGAWLLANLKGALLLSTSNRSEAAVGYATMDGDTSGGLSPIAGIDKAFLRQWLVWLEKEGPLGLRPIPALSVVNEQDPTAELRPPTSKQTDEADLMPYPVLDAIERAAIRDKQMPVEVYQLMLLKFPRYDGPQMGVWVERFFRLWCRNQWKRERYAPCFHLDDENLDPKTWCRFPILSGGFDVELQELRRVVGRG
ncbi:MAG: NAD(+) synthase [Verrucomicrobia bacterium]|nr:NAD(+) synthase [Verrucomicrobiota bacterium]MBI3871165.1 NAD(+) synthase [Verrucomicrobiota bacterium]